jgi:hypothetical protein
VKESDNDQFFNFLEGCADTYGKEIKPIQAKIFFNALAEYSFRDVEAAFNAHITKSRYFPTPADIIGNIPKSIMDNHIGADEAWQTALLSMDEATSVIVNEQILEARGIAMDIYHSGDKVGARMAFRDAYNRITLENPKPKWFVSLGHDKDGREHVKAKFEEMKLLGKEKDNVKLDSGQKFLGIK